MFFRLVILLFLLYCTKEHSHSHNELYYCPMHPQITSHKPGSCPICHMKLVKKETQNLQTENQPKKVEISKEKQAWIGIQTSKVTQRKLKKVLSFAGTVAYEPELFTALSEYSESLKQKGNELLHSAELSSIAYTRLLQLGLSKEGIQFLAPRKNELITGGKNTAIIVARIYEGEIANILPYSLVTVYSPSYPHINFQGKIQALDGVLDPETRTLRAWILASNPQNALKPQMIVEVEIHIELKEALTVPSSSIIHIGKTSIVYKKLSETEFSPQEVLTGAEAENFTEIVKGLGVNDEIITHGIFLIDSETKIQTGSR